MTDIGFRAECGERITIVGKNGCGKSTLLQIMAGALKADGGSIRYFGKDICKNPGAVRRYCGYVPQDNPLLEELSVKDNLYLWAKDKGDGYENVIRQFGLKEILNMPVEKLSGGMKRRLSIACALLHLPSVLLLDEPTTALDLFYKDSIQRWMNQYRNMNGIIVMTTHDEMEILSADRCLVMREGRVAELEKSELTINNIKKIIAEA